MKDTRIIYENEEILIIDKPFGLSVQGGEGVKVSLDEGLSKELGYKIHLVHRLDKETAGLMVVAKSSKAANKWISLISSKQVKKEYTAICFGNPVLEGKEVMQGTLKNSLVKNGRELSAVTHFEVLSSKDFEFKMNEAQDSILQKINLSVLHLTLGTGRMHQIRIHLAKALCPIVGDDRHGNFKLNKKIRSLKIKKLCLASTKLTIPTAMGKNMVFEISLPEHMQKIMDLMKN